jgi:hypothetical protein
MSSGVNPVTWTPFNHGDGGVNATVVARLAALALREKGVDSLIECRRSINAGHLTSASRPIAGGDNGRAGLVR